jgi:hypothetical protein
MRHSDQAHGAGSAQQLFLPGLPMRRKIRLTVIGGPCKLRVPLGPKELTGLVSIRLGRVEKKSIWVPE